MSEQVMHRLGFEVSRPAPFCAKMANNIKVKCLGIVNAVRVKAFNIEVDMDIYVMPTKGEGYPIILGRPWLMAMKAKQDWGTGLLKLRSPKGKEVFYNMKTVVQHHINLKEGIKPTVQRLRRLRVIQQDALLSEVTPKKNGKWRVCVDYKPLNAATKRDHFPLTFQDVILNEVAGYECYTMCDGYSGYFQIRIAEEDQKKTTFVTPWGCFAYRVMPFGLTNAPATFQRYVTYVFQPLFGKSIRVFIDGFCIYSSHSLHLEKVYEAFYKLQILGGQLNVEKCHIAKSKVALLGHVISAKGIEADPSKVQALVSLPPPTTAKQLVSFLEKVRYLSRFIHLLSQVVLPLQQLTHQDVFTWSEESEQQFQEVTAKHI
ncbi:hypothetical protein L7F22_022806 [Adiantum nelumboides]|nr:hypothetical protein [Adiantum nelumboides]